jgi:murein DD-endopeptidase MepM/ murein hydrolase activator NlpD
LAEYNFSRSLGVRSFSGAAEEGQERTAAVRSFGSAAEERQERPAAARSFGGGTAGRQERPTAARLFGDAAGGQTRRAAIRSFSGAVAKGQECPAITRSSGGAAEKQEQRPTAVRSFDKAAAERQERPAAVRSFGKTAEERQERPAAVRSFGGSPAKRPERTAAARSFGGTAAKRRSVAVRSFSGTAAEKRKRANTRSFSDVTEERQERPTAAARSFSGAAEEGQKHTARSPGGAAEERQKHLAAASFSGPAEEEQKRFSPEATTEKRGLPAKALSAIATRIDHKAEAGLSRDKTGDVQSRSRALAGKYAVRGFRHARGAAAGAARGALRHISLGVTLRRATRRGELSGKEAGAVYRRHAARAAGGGAVSAGRFLRREAGEAVRGFRGGQDAGLQALTRARDVVYQARNVYRLGKGIVRLLASPIIRKTMLIAALLIIVFSFVVGGVSAITSVVPVISLKSEDQALTETWIRITELDADLKAEVLGVAGSHPGIDEFHYYLNNRSIALSRIDVKTDAEALLAYLDSKYDDYSLAKLIIPPGGGLPHDVRAEISRLHDLLYDLALNEWEEIIYTSDSDPDDGVDDSSETIIYHMDVRLTAKPFTEYLTENADALLTAAEQEKMDALSQAGLFTTRRELGSPFPEEGWVSTDRFGYRIHPVYQEKRLHTGLDIPKSEGTPVYACHSGTATVGGDAATGYGLWVRISKTNGDSTFYAHLRSQTVTDGAAIRKGDLVGLVGSTGVSTGPHLHLEYTKKSVTLNPLFYTPGMLTAVDYIGNVLTHKFHRPTCWTLPNPENRSYFSRREDAVSAGYVPCLNCRP